MGPSPNRSDPIVQAGSSLLRTARILQQLGLAVGDGGTVIDQSRQRPGPPRHDPTRLALSNVSEGERARIVVSRPHADSRRGTRKTMIVALARKLIIALWRFVTTVHDHDVDEQCRAIADSTD